MSTDEEKGSHLAVQNDSDEQSPASSILQEEYEELLRYAVVTSNIESGTLQPSHSKGEVLPDIRIPTAVYDTVDNQENDPVVKEAKMEVGKGGLNASSHSKTDGSPPLSLSPRKSSYPVMDFFSSHVFDSLPGSAFSSRVDDRDVGLSDFLVSDENLQKMENVLDRWSSGLKTNIISELNKWKLNFIDWHRTETRKEREKHAADVKQLQNQINGLKELQKAYEISIGRKDEVISSLSHAISKQKERVELMRTFFHWRISHVRSRQDAYEIKIAEQHFQHTLLKKVWRAWHSIVQRKWKEVVERACQARAEEVCVQLSNDYESRVAMLCGALENAKAEIQRMQHEKEHFEDSMKKAFMRGVCALNLEAMTMFQGRSDTGTDLASSKKEEGGPGGKDHPTHLDHSASSLPSSSAARPLTPPAAVGVPNMVAFPSATSFTSGAASLSSAHLPVPPPPCAGSAAACAASEEMYVPRIVTSAQQKAGRTITARITGKCDFSSKNRINSSLAIMGVSPPMSSVVVEKHHPVTVQTIPQATAAKYPRSIHPESGTSASRSVGNRSAHTQSLASMHSIKVVD